MEYIATMLVIAVMLWLPLFGLVAHKAYKLRMHRCPAKPVLSAARSAGLKTCGNHTPANRCAKKAASKRRRSTGGGAPADKPQAEKVPRRWSDGYWDLLTRQERPPVKTLSNRQANRAAARLARKEQAGGDGVTFVNILAPGAVTGDDKPKMETHTATSINHVPSRTSNTGSADTLSMAANTTSPASSGSGSSSSSLRVSASGVEAVVGSNPVAVNQFTSTAVSFRDVVLLGPSALAYRRSLGGRAWHKTCKRSSKALDVTKAAAVGLYKDAGRGLGSAADDIALGFDNMALNCQTLAMKTERRIKGAVHKVDKTFTLWGSKVAGQAKEVTEVCGTKAGALKQRLSKVLLFGR